MIVRVFRWTGAQNEEYSGVDYHFDVMPAIGQSLRMTGFDDLTVQRVGFIQEDDRFVASVWLEERTGLESEDQSVETVDFAYDVDRYGDPVPYSGY